MKHAYVLLGALSAWLAVSTAAAQQNPVYFGLKAGRMDADAAGFGQASNIGLIFGFDLSQDDNGVFSFEGEYTRHISDGNVAVGGIRGDWKIETLAGYGAYRTAGDVYVKAKAGMLHEDLKVSVAGGAISSGKETGFSFGSGVGWRFNRKTGLELEYTVIEEDVRFLSLGYFTHF